MMRSVLSTLLCFHIQNQKFAMRLARKERKSFDVTWRPLKKEFSDLTKAHHYG